MAHTEQVNWDSFPHNLVSAGFQIPENQDVGFRWKRQKNILLDEAPDSPMETNP